MRKIIVAVLTGLVMIVSGFGLTGCFQQTDEEVSVTIPSVDTVAEASESLARLSVAFYVSPEDAEAIAGVIDYICDNIKNAEGSTSQFMLNAISTAIDAGKCPEYTRYLLIGVVNLLDEFFQLKDFNIEDCTTVLNSFSNGLKQGEVSAQSVVLGW